MDAGCCGDYCCQGYCNRFGVFGEFLYLKPRGAEVAYAVAIEGDIVDPNPAALARSRTWKSVMAGLRGSVW